MPEGRSAQVTYTLYRATSTLDDKDYAVVVAEGFRGVEYPVIVGCLPDSWKESILNYSHKVRLQPHQWVKTGGGDSDYYGARWKCALCGAETHGTHKASGKDRAKGRDQCPKGADVPFCSN